MQRPKLSETDYNFILNCSNMSLKQWMKLSLKDYNRCNDIIIQYFSLSNVNFSIVPEMNEPNCFLFRRNKLQKETHRIFVRENNIIDLVELLNATTIS